MSTRRLNCSRPSAGGGICAEEAGGGSASVAGEESQLNEKRRKLMEWCRRSNVLLIVRMNQNASVIVAELAVGGEHNGNPCNTQRAQSIHPHMEALVTALREQL